MENDKEQTARMSDKLDNLKRVMQDNVGLALERGEDLENLKKKSGDLEKENHKGFNIMRQVKEQTKNNYFSQTAIFLGVMVGGVGGTVIGYGFFQVVLSMVVGGGIGYSLNKLRENIMRCFSSDTHEPIKLSEQTQSQAQQPSVIDSLGLGKQPDPIINNSLKKRRSEIDRNNEHHYQSRSVSPTRR